MLLEEGTVFLLMQMVKKYPAVNTCWFGKRGKTMENF